MINNRKDLKPALREAARCSADRIEQLEAPITI
jgi:hypothetical protein